MYLCDRGENYCILSRYTNKSRSDPRTGLVFHLEGDGIGIGNRPTNRTLQRGERTPDFLWTLTGSYLDTLEGTLVKAEAVLYLEAGGQKQS